MGQITIRFGDREIEEIDKVLQNKGLETRSELIRRAWTVYKTIAQQEINGYVFVAMPATKMKDEPIRIAI